LKFVGGRLQLLSQRVLAARGVVARVQVQAPLSVLHLAPHLRLELRQALEPDLVLQEDLARS
jgi:hypothetical protein